MITYNSLCDYIKNKGAKTPDNVDVYNAERANTLTGDAQTLALWLCNVHPDIPKNYDAGYFYNSSTRFQFVYNILNALPEGKNLWEMSNYDTFWANFLPKHWAVLAKNAWHKISIYEKCYVLNALSTEWAFYEIDMYEYIDFNSALVSQNGNSLSPIIVQIIDSGDEKLADKIKDVLQNQAEIGEINTLIISIALRCNRPDLWAIMNNLLLAAQRQEGLRTSIINNLLSAHSGAKALILQRILDNNLTRFASVLAILQQWINLPLADGLETNEKNIGRLIPLIIRFFNEKGGYTEGVLKGNNYTEIYLQLWTLAQINETDFWLNCDKLMQDSDPKKRAIALYSVYVSPITSSDLKGFNFVKKYLNDPDLMVRWQVLQNLEKQYGDNLYTREDGAYAFCERLINELPDAGLKHLKPQFAWENYQFDVKRVLNHWVYRVARSTNQYKDLLPYQNRMDANMRGNIVTGHFQAIYEKINAGRLADIDFQPTEFERNWILNAIQDKSATVTGVGFLLYNLLIPKKEELPILYSLLTRKTDETRKAILKALMTLNDADLQASIDVLLTAKTEEQRLAGLDVLQQLKQQNRLPEFILASAKTFQNRKNIGSKAELIVQDLLDDANQIFDKNNGFGLYNPENCLEKPILEKPTTGFFIEKMYGKPMFGFSMSLEEFEGQIKQLDALVTAHENYEYEVEYWDKSLIKALISNEYFELKKSTNNTLSYQETLAMMPLAEVWEDWLKASKLTALDRYLLCGYSTAYAFATDAVVPDWLRELVKNYTQDYTTPLFIDNRLGLKYPSHCQTIMRYLRDDEAIRDLITDIEIDLTTHYFASIPESGMDERFIYQSYMTEPTYTWREVFKGYYGNFEQWQRPVSNGQKTTIETMPDAIFKRFWAANYWYFRKLSPFYTGNDCCQEAALGRAFEMGLIGKDAFYYLALNTGILAKIANFSNVNAQNTVKQYPIFQEFLAKTIPHLLTIELKRGDTATPVSNFVQCISTIKGLDYFIKIIKGLGKDALNRGYSYYGASKVIQFSRLLKNCTPSVSDTFEAFKTALEAHKITEKRLIQVALYAPQWLPWAEKYLGWDSLESAAWCLHAHANNYFDVQKESELAKYTTVSTQDFQDGAVDIAWFKDVYTALGEKNWELVYEAAHYICDNQGYIRARIYADAILGKLSLDDCKNRITDKRNKEYVVALGLIVLAKKNPQKDILERYRFIQNFQKQSKDFGQQRQASEKRVCDLAMENLARNAGYPDPVRLTWAMETLDVQELLQRANAVNIDGTSVQLQVNALGKAAIFAIKGVKTLKDVPSALKRDPSVLELISIKNNLNSQYNRIKKSLEDAMIRGDIFLLNEIENLMQHPVIKPLLSSLVLLSDTNKTGFYAEKSLRDADGMEVKLTNKNTLKIAHCCDLHASGQWAAYQKQAFQQQLIQPFKQVFRELYLPNTDELASVGVSKRYAGYQIQVSQAAALFRSRGWSANYGEGVQKVYHRERIVATVDAYADWFNVSQNTAPTDIEAIRFFSKNKHEALPLKDIPKAIFSEIMRDLDLVVSVAHVGGVDIEASLSSIELRAVIVEETAVLFQLTNVTIEKNHIFIKGKKGDYTIHLGSGIAHKVPAQMLSISPVSTQSRGRIFLPFVDEDPKTAEIVSKVLLLAKDGEILDPSVLSQL